MVKRETSIVGLLATGAIVATGTFWAFQRGGKDFDVFFQAWRLVLNGHGPDIYRVSPDRFLYAPGFAWLFSPLGLLPRDLALASWCLAKAAVLGLMLRQLGGRLFRDSTLATGIAGWAVLLMARPFLIDFQYGQVNTFILGACVWALLRHFSAEAPSRTSDWHDRVSWAVLSVAAVTKLFPLPLLLVPWLAKSQQPSRKIRNERAGLAIGLTLILLVPAVEVGFSGLAGLHEGWVTALQMKGFPLESHNQSFAAFLHHYFSGQPTPVISEGGALLPFGFGFLTSSVIRGLSLLWTAALMAAILFWLARGWIRRAPLEWLAVAIGLLILPSHLVWKPYFIFGLPLAILAVHRWNPFSDRKGMLSYVIFFTLINLTGFDFVGHQWGARFEAGAILLWMHILLIFTVLKSKSKI